MAREAGVAGALLVALALFATSAAAQQAAVPAGAEERFRAATRQLQAGDAPKAIVAYHELAAAGCESGSLYWNWSQAATARGAIGEALWALLRAREIGGADAATVREIERLRRAANLDAAEIAPDPLAALARGAKTVHLDIAAVVLLLLSLAAHAAARLLPAARWPVALAWVTLLGGGAAAATALVGTRAYPTAVVLHTHVPLADAASPSATVLATLREGEVVPVLGASGAYLRIQDSSGARGWVTVADVRRLDRPPAAAP